MKKGFRFDHNKCVGCNACSAACILENGWDFQPRKIYTYNSDVLSIIPFANLSLACNHCEKAVCLEGCPAGAYYKDPGTGAVLIDDTKCIGCKYCQWNCPYDAPKFNTAKRTISKCNFCYQGFDEGRIPACASACPSGALDYGEITKTKPENRLLWFPEKDLDPGIELTGKNNGIPLRIIPERSFKEEIVETREKPDFNSGDWSLIIFSFLTTLSVSLIVSSLIKGIMPDMFLYISLIVLAVTASIFHLGKVMRAWRAISNLRRSPLSREIAVFLIFSAVSLSAVIFELPVLLIVSSITGLILLMLIDNVYIYSDRRNPIIFHSGQTFLSSLLIISFFTGSVIPFMFTAAIKLGSLIYNLHIKDRTGYSFGIRFLRAALLLSISVSIIKGIPVTDPVIIFLFLAGELYDRIIFYIDFDPLNITTLIYKQIKSAIDEKKRS